MLKTTRRNKEDREVEINDHTNNNRGIKSNFSVKIVLKAHGTPLLLHPSHSVVCRMDIDRYTQILRLRQQRMCAEKIQFLLLLCNNIIITSVAGEQDKRTTRRNNCTCVMISQQALLFAHKYQQAIN